MQREGVEFEFDVAAEMDLDHNLIVVKTRCPALDGVVVNRPGAELAETLRTWIEDGEAPAPPAPAPGPATEQGAATEPAAAAQVSLASAELPLANASDWDIIQLIAGAEDKAELRGLHARAKSAGALDEWKARFGQVPEAAGKAVAR